MSALQHLCRIADDAKIAKYPNVPASRIPRSKYTDRTANGLTTCVMAWLQLNGHFCARINTGGIYDEKLGKYRPSGATLGVPDIIACIRGRFVGLEIKIGADKLSQQQKDVARQIESSLGFFVVVYSFEQFFSWYEEFTRPPFL
ncbi:VRR-NUC domain-containing protein [Spirosoma sp. 48-14]|uniref:VRR-NUC domain-containing protein n=1 Tax=Spirosoma sp. 48-14 TaxID=1895854 RepID=UPI00095A8EFF|nr:VRR-NUC domain-containing protein [Spirosoma sp. 48-14]OJW74282.1 MAG: hypothetical protein BGO59_14300 [Spirosoma sp. 48-14]